MNLKRPLPAPYSPQMEELAAITDIPVSKARRIVRNARSLGASLEVCILACIYSGRAGRGSEDMAIQLAKEALADRKTAGLLRKNMQLILSARRILTKNGFSGNSRQFLEVSLFGDWRRETRKKYKSL